jgi:hypothetical protein
MSIQRAGRLLILPFILAIWIGLAGVPALALAELRVPQDYKTIQEAIDAASQGDTILIDPGTYVENLRVDKRGLTIRGTDPEQVIIQAKFPDLPVVTIRERNVALLGLTLTGGQQGVKVEPRADNPTLSNLVVRSNRAEGLFVEGVRGGELARARWPRTVARVSSWAAALPSGWSGTGSWGAQPAWRPSTLMGWSSTRTVITRE